MSKTIKILGTGCPNCKRAEAVIKTVVAELNADVTIEKVEDIQDIMTYDVMSTPAIVIDEKVVIKGRVPSFDEIKNLLNEENASSDTNSSCCEPIDKKETDSCCGSDTSSNCC